MSRQTLRDWLHRHNDEGVGILGSRTGPGRPRVLTPARLEEFREMVIRGPDPEWHTVMRWRCADLRQELAARFSVPVCEQTVGRWLLRLGMTAFAAAAVSPEEGPGGQGGF